MVPILMIIMITMIIMNTMVIMNYIMEFKEIISKILQDLKKHPLIDNTVCFPLKVIKDRQCQKKQRKHLEMKWKMWMKSA